MARINIMIDDDIYKKLQILAKNDERSLSSYVKILLKQHVFIQSNLDTSSLSSITNHQPSSRKTIIG